MDDGWFYVEADEMARGFLGHRRYVIGEKDLDGHAAVVVKEHGGDVGDLRSGRKAIKGWLRSAGWGKFRDFFVFGGSMSF